MSRCLNMAAHRIPEDHFSAPLPRAGVPAFPPVDPWKCKRCGAVLGAGLTECDPCGEFEWECDAQLERDAEVGEDMRQSDTEIRL